MTAASRMRLALTHAYSWPEVRRGAERIIHELSLALAGRGHAVTVYTAGRPVGRVREAGVETVRLRRWSADEARHERVFGLELVPRLLSGGFDATHSLGTRDAVAAIRAARLRPHPHRTVYTNLGNPVREWWDTRPDGAAQRRIVRDVDVYGCMSRYSLRTLRETYGREGTLTPGGVRLSQFEPRAQREARPTVLFSGALSEPRKGVAVLLQAIALLRRREPDIALWLSGPGDASSVIAAAPEGARDRVTLLPLGGATDQAERYGRAWVTALPSRGDSFGMAVLESLACGTPIAVSDDAALPELVDAGRTGATCDAGSAESVAAAIATCLELARRPVTAEACRAAAAPYDWDAGLAPAFERLYAGG